MNRAGNRKALYKASTPPWKETYRKRCLERLHLSRGKLLDRYRKIGVDFDSQCAQDEDDYIKDLMSEEWESFWNEKKEMSQLPDLPEDLSFLMNADVKEKENIDRVLNIFEEIEEELKQEELKLLAEYEHYQEGLKEEEAELCSALEQLTSDEVICPICQKHALLQNKSVIFCKCGVRINTEQDHLNLANVKQQLKDGMELHNFTCSDDPEFSVTSALGATNIFMTCKECDFMHIVI